MLRLPARQASVVADFCSFSRELCEFLQGCIRISVPPLCGVFRTIHTVLVAIISAKTSLCSYQHFLLPICDTLGAYRDYVQERKVFGNRLAGHNVQRGFMGIIENLSKQVGQPQKRCRYM